MGYHGCEQNKAPWIRFDKQQDPKKKLPTWKMYNQHSGVYLGEIHFRGGWRQFVSNPVGDRDFSIGCQEEILTFCKLKLKEWRESLRKKVIK